ncbi:YjbH domain-containing protein [Pigmentiphaga litoralis]|uniref:YjbH domain-containing protein n=1 Tax=Pigmentiphaga litoralis TaxID=516702 RepID=UPI00227D8E67|nr:YjbH domain-containing protein [Pigmentiphaga litoralis]
MPGALWAQAAQNGLTGLINTPSARMQDDGVFRIGVTHASPYTAGFFSLQAMPWLEATARYTQIAGVDGGLGPDYGSFKDKSVGAKVRLLEEGAFGISWLPQFAVGMDDRGTGTGIFASEFVVANKKFGFNGVGVFDVSAGYGRKRLDGAFGGVRFSPQALPNWRLVVERDATNFARDYGSAESGVNTRPVGKWNAAVEYTRGPFTLQLGSQYGKPSVAAYFSIPFQAREFVPKINETGPLAKGAWYSDAPRPTAAQWDEDRGYRQGMLATLHDEGFRNVKLAYRNGTMVLSLTSERFRYQSRGIGRAARIALAYAPLETKAMEITWENQDLAAVTYRFGNAEVLQRYFAGLTTREALAAHVDIRYAAPPKTAAQTSDIDQVLDAVAYERPKANFAFNRDGNLFNFRRESYDQSRFQISPYFSTYLNDPSGAFKYDVGLDFSARLRIAQGWWADGSVRTVLSENVSDVAQESNSDLPHVRSDAAKYKRASKIKLDRALLHRYWQPAERVYTRASAGIYEEMFGGAGVQALWVAPGSRWAVDGSFDMLKQRDYKGTGFLDYRTSTYLMSVHHRVPWLDGVTVTARGGRFLAGDEGVRGEIKRTFKSGMEVGVWYTVTNGNDIQSPGSPDAPYRDKGVFMRIPLATMLATDTGAAANFSLQPWTRDVGAMVRSPGDLYDQFERGMLQNATEGDGLRSFSDVIGEDAP